jgi:hypothetical protein
MAVVTALVVPPWASGVPGVTTIICPVWACSFRLGTAQTTAETTIHASWAGAHLRHDDGHREQEGEVVHAVPIGTRVTLEPGFVNSTNQHVSGLPWYRYRRGSPDAPPRGIKVPAMVTCKCGRDVLLAADETARFYATAPAEDRAERLVDELTEEAGDRYIDGLVDEGR